MELAIKQTHWSMELNQRLRCKFIHVWTPVFFDKEATGKITASSTNGIDQTECMHVEECKHSLTYNPAENSPSNGSKTSIWKQIQEPDRRKSGKYPWTNCHGRSFAERNTDNVRIKDNG